DPVDPACIVICHKPGKQKFVQNMRACAWKYAKRARDMARPSALLGLGEVPQDLNRFPNGRHLPTLRCLTHGKRSLFVRRADGMIQDRSGLYHATVADGKCREGAA